MALYVYITRECEEDAKKHNRYSELLRFKERLEKTQRMCLFDNFPPPYLKKRFVRQIRLLADRRTIPLDGEEHVVVNFLRTYVRSSKEYRQFLDKPDEFGKRFLLPLISDNDLSAYLGERLKKRPIPPKSPPSEIENHFLYRFLGGDAHRKTEEFVCESSSWVQSTGNERVRNRLDPIWETLGSVVDAKVLEMEYSVREYTLVYRWFPILNKHFLAGIVQNEEEKHALYQLYDDILSPPREEVTEEQLLRRSSRTYPSTLFADVDAWMDIQKDTESNLALSPEETEVLESVHCSEGGFPIFINGRAGSGKSTILYYLFADYISLYLELNENDLNLSPPLLLSCSQELRNQAEDKVCKLIRCNPKWWSGNGAAIEVPGACFQQFQAFLRNLVPPKEREERFSEAKYVDYAKFRTMWQDQFGKNKNLREEGPDLSWHVIRTFIKGSNSQDYLEPEEYEHLPRKQKSVSREKFTAVFTCVWEGWYKGLCEGAGYWDDQDLARYVFESDWVEPSYPAVFCDEAQDFTRVELDLLFSLCLFVGRKLRHEDIRRVPFAFAGDPYQTINPTGFRWDAVQALYHDRLEDTLGENLHRQIELNYKELNLNYRSSTSIVKLCNLIQALRASLFDIPTLRPQESWQRDQRSPMPVWFDRNRLNDWRQLKDEKDATIIVPCMLNEEPEFIAKDDYLKDIVQMDASGTPINVLSPARAKGLEFARVVLYGFAEAKCADLLHLLEKSELDRDQLLPFEYFLNQLYVSASRPKRRLFIIDDQEGRDRLWKIGIDETLQRKMWNRIPKGRDIWASHIGGFEIGTPESWSEERGNLEENARQYEQQGMSTQDSFLLRSAAGAYDHLSRSVEANKCRAYAFKFEKNYSEAGDHFSRAGDPDEAFACFWAAGTGASEKVLSLRNAFPNLAKRIEYRLIETYCHRSPERIVAGISELAQRAQADDRLKLRLSTEATFGDIVWSFAKFMTSGSINREELTRFLTVLEVLLKIGLPGSSSLLADVYFHAGRYQEAMACWESVEGHANWANYKEARAITLSENFERDPKTILPSSDYAILADHFLKEKKYLLATQCMTRVGRPKDLVEFVVKIPDGSSALGDIVLKLVGALAEHGEWNVLIDLATLSLGRRLRGFSQGVEAKAKARASEIRNAIVVTCATHPDLQNQTSSILKKYSDYFKEVISMSREWEKGLTLQMVGAAMETAGRQVDILQFYEQFTKNKSMSRKDRQFARERWVVTKEKQAKRESDEGHEQAAARYQREANEKRREYGLMDVKLPDLPSVEAVLSVAEPEREGSGNTSTDVDARPPDPEVSAPDIDRAAAPKEAPATTEFELGGLRFEFRPALGKVNITHLETMNTANIRADARAVRSSDVDIRPQGKLFICEEWSSECRFVQEKGVISAVFRLKGYGISIVFDFPQSSE